MVKISLIQFNARGIVDSMTSSQFADPFIFTREDGQNHYDATKMALIAKHLGIPLDSLDLEARLGNLGKDILYWQDFVSADEITRNPIRITVKYDKEIGAIIYHSTDTGKGMSPEDRDSKLRTLFASGKEEVAFANGRNGIGNAALPAFFDSFIYRSKRNGFEGWEMYVEDLDAHEPTHFDGPNGTAFIGFKDVEEKEAKEIINKIKEAAAKYLNYLRIPVYLNDVLINPDLGIQKGTISRIGNVEVTMFDEKMPNVYLVADIPVEIIPPHLKTKGYSFSFNCYGLKTTLARSEYPLSETELNSLIKSALSARVNQVAGRINPDSNSPANSIEQLSNDILNLARKEKRTSVHQSDWVQNSAREAHTPSVSANSDSRMVAFFEPNGRYVYFVDGTYSLITKEGLWRKGERKAISMNEFKLTERRRRIYAQVESSQDIALLLPFGEMLDINSVRFTNSSSNLVKEIELNSLGETILHLTRPYTGSILYDSREVDFASGNPLVENAPNGLPFALKVPRNLEQKLKKSKNEKAFAEKLTTLVSKYIEYDDSKEVEDLFNGFYWLLQEVRSYSLLPGSLTPAKFKDLLTKFLLEYKKISKFSLDMEVNDYFELFDGGSNVNLVNFILHERKGDCDTKNSVLAALMKHYGDEYDYSNIAKAKLVTGYLGNPANGAVKSSWGHGYVGVDFPAACPEIYDATGVRTVFRRSRRQSSKDTSSDSGQERNRPSLIKQVISSVQSIFQNPYKDLANLLGSTEYKLRAKEIKVNEPNASLAHLNGLLSYGLPNIITPRNLAITTLLGVSALCLGSLAMSEMFSYTAAAPVVLPTATPTPENFPSEDTIKTIADGGKYMAYLGGTALFTLLGYQFSRRVLSKISGKTKQKDYDQKITKMIDFEMTGFQSKERLSFVMREQYSEITKLLEEGIDSVTEKIMDSQIIPTSDGRFVTLSTIKKIANSSSFIPMLMPGHPYGQILAKHGGFAIEDSYLVEDLLRKVGITNYSKSIEISKPITTKPLSKDEQAFILYLDGNMLNGEYGVFFDEKVSSTQLKYVLTPGIQKAIFLPRNSKETELLMNIFQKDKNLALCAVYQLAHINVDYGMAQTNIAKLAASKT